MWESEGLEAGAIATAGGRERFTGRVRGLGFWRFGRCHVGEEREGLEAASEGRKEERTIRTVILYFRRLYIWLLRFFTLYTHFSRIHPSSISSSIHCGAHLSLYLNISV
jgi:hypothetical protein